jgi:hypothetical protein
MTAPASDFGQRLRPPVPEPSDPIAASGGQQRGATVSSEAVGLAEVALTTGYKLGTKTYQEAHRQVAGRSGGPASGQGRKQWSMTHW